MKRTILILIIILNLVFLQSTSAQVLNLSSDKSVYMPGDTITIYLEINNSLNIEKTIDIYITIEEENNSYPPSSLHYSVDLLPLETKNITVYTTNVSEYMVNGDYIVYAIVLENGFAIYSDNINFSITGLPEYMDVDILLSNDGNFNFLKDVFKINETIYIGYNSSIDNIEISCSIFYPDNSSKLIALPYSFTPNHIGLYSLSITAQKQGYRNVTKSTQFAVIGKTYSVPEKEGKEEQPFILYLSLILIIVVIVLAFFVIRRKIKGK